MFFTLYLLLWSIPLIFAALLFVRYQKLQLIPGPLLTSFTDLWRAYRQNTGNWTKTLRQLHEDYGPLVRLGPNTVSVSDAAAVTTIYTMHGEFRKADSYAPLRVLANGRVLGSIFDMQDEQLISGLKRAVGAAFAVKNLLDYEHDVDVTAAELIGKILKSRTIDVFDTLQRFQIDFLTIMAFSESPDYLNNTKDVHSVSAKARIGHWIQWQAMPTLEHLIYKPPYLGNFMKSAVPIWVQMANQKLQNRLATEKGGSGRHADLLQKYIDGGKKHAETVKPEMVQRMVSSTISAGSDTTAFTMTAMIYHLLKNPHTLTKLQQELETAVAAGQLSNPPKYLETADLRYLSAVLKETMRISPFLAVLLERVVPAGGALVAGTWLPGGTAVGCHPVLVHRDRDCFGEDADVFRPERWLTDDTERLIAMERASLGFGSGKRACMGRHIAELEIKKVIPALLLRFKMSLVDPQVAFESADNITTFPKPIMVTFKERS